MKFDNQSEEDFYDFLNDFELTSMIRGIKSQVEVLGGKRRVDFIITLTNNEIIYVEVDGKYHKEIDVMKKDEYKDYLAQKSGISTLRIKFSDFYRNKEMVANRIEEMIDILSY